MTNRSKFVLSAAVLLAAMVIASSIYLAVAASKKTGEATSIFAGVSVALVAVLSVMAVYMGKVRKSKSEGLLDEGYFEAYEQIKDAIAASDLPGARMKEITEEVLDMLLSAQKAGRSPKDSVGEPKVFIARIMEASTSRGRLLVSGAINGIAMFICFILGFTLVMWTEDPNAGYFGTAVDASLVVMSALISFVVMPLTKALVRKSMLAFGIPLASGILFIAAVELLKANPATSEATRVFLDGSIRMVPSGYALGGYMAALAVLWFGTKALR